MSLLDHLKISLVSQGPAVSLYARDNCIAAVGKSHGTNQGGTGYMTEHGLAYLVWHDGQPFLAAKGGERAATPEEVTAIQEFSRDLTSALSTASNAL